MYFTITRASRLISYIFKTDVLVKPGFDVEDLSEDGPDDLEGLDASAAHVAYLLSTEPSDSKFLLPF